MRHSARFIGSFALGLSLAAGPAAAVVCVDPDDGDCFATIQAGVDAAAPGEVVEIAAGLYEDKVAITTNGLILRGKGAVLDVESGAPPDDAITIGAPNVVIEGLAVRNGATAITVNGVGGTVIRGVSIVSADDFCIELNDVTSNVRIEGSRLQGCRDRAVVSDASDGLVLTGNTIEGSDGVDLTGADIRVERNTFARDTGTCTEIVGADALVTGNRYDLCSSGISIEGDDATVTRNTLANTDGTAVAVDGDDFVVEGNSFTSSGRGVDASCEFSCGTARIVRNRMTTLAGSGVVAEAIDGGLLIEANQISQATGAGISLETFDAVVTGNRMSSVGGSGDECLDLVGSANQVAGNGLAGCGGDGIKVDGDDNTVEGNRISNTGDDGIDVVADSDNTQVLDNQASGATDNGIEVSEDAIGTIVSDNSPSGLHADYCDGGTTTGGVDVPDDTTDCGLIDD